jgi:hypothetical protein
MKQLFIFLLVFAATNSFGQITNGKTTGIILADTGKNPNRDTTLRVIYVDRNKPERQPAFIINGKYVMNQSFISSLDAKWIEHIEVVKGDTLVNNVRYYGQIHIKTRSNYNPKAISLTELKNKYTEFKGNPVIFMIDGDIVNADYDNYVIDENNLLTIIVDKFQNAKDGIELGLIKLLTKSEQNIKKREQIMLRGIQEKGSFHETDH